VSSVGSLRSRFPLEPWYPLKDDRRLAVPPANLVEQPAPTFFGSTAITPAQRFQSVVSFSHSLHLHRILFGGFVPGGNVWRFHHQFLIPFGVI
jgi:hypothetical protein